MNASQELYQRIMRMRPDVDMGFFMAGDVQAMLRELRRENVELMEERDSAQKENEKLRARLGEWIEL